MRSAAESGSDESSARWQAFSAGAQPLAVRGGGARLVRTLPESEPEAAGEDEPLSELGDLPQLRLEFSARLFDRILEETSGMTMLRLPEHSTLFTMAGDVRLQLDFRMLRGQIVVDGILYRGLHVLALDCWRELMEILIKGGIRLRPLLVAAIANQEEEIPVEIRMRVVRTLLEKRRLILASNRAGDLTARSGGARALMTDGRLDFSWCAGTGE